jgi:hypothetical protein
MNQLNIFILREVLDRDALSPPYLFVIAINELSLRLQEALHNFNLQGVILGGAPRIHSLPFADDLILCGQATTEEAQAIKTILYDFCHQSRQTPNLNKSSIYFSTMFLNTLKLKSKVFFLFLLSNLIPCI